MLPSVFWFADEALLSIPADSGTSWITVNVAEGEEGEGETADVEKCLKPTFFLFHLKRTRAAQ